MEHQSSGGSSPHPLILRPNWVEKKILETAPNPPPPYLRVWTTLVPPLPEGLFPSVQSDVGL